MFFLKMISRSFSRQFKRRLLIAVTVCLSATVSVAMLGVVFDVGDKLNAELSTYGSNIVVQPKSDAVVSDLYNTGDSAGSASGSSSGSDGGSTSDGSAAADSADPTAFLKESDAQKIKTIFWAFNITNFAPELNIHADAGCVGSGGWFGWLCWNGWCVRCGCFRGEMQGDQRADRGHVVRENPAHGLRRVHRGRHERHALMVENQRNLAERRQRAGDGRQRARRETGRERR